MPIWYLRTDQIVNPVDLATGDAPLTGDYGFRASLRHEARVKLGLMLGLMPSLSLKDGGSDKHLQADQYSPLVFCPVDALVVKNENEQIANPAET